MIAFSGPAAPTAPDEIARRAHRTVVIGLGNPLMGDDGFGLAALARLREWTLPDDVVLEDGGTWGLNLLPIVESTGRVLFLDAVRVGAAPGTDVMLVGDAIPRRLSTKLSPHQVDLREVLALAAWRGALPDEVVAIGVEPAYVDLGDTLSPVVAARLDEVVAMAVAQLRRWGHCCVAPRAAE